MSHVKKNKFAILILFLFVSFFMFGCENSTPVKDIYFDLENNKQIVLIVGQTLEMKDYVVIKPAYATNKKYKIFSYNEEIVDVENNKLVALQAGYTQIKVVADDNKLKESVMSVIVKASKSVLDAPTNFSYNEGTQSFVFDYVPYASSYTLKVNGKEIDLGNTNSYSISQLGADAYNKKLVVQVRANAPTYTYALENSVYSSEIEIYQAGVVNNAQVKGGVLTFDKVSKDAIYNVYINGNLIVENTTENTISLKNLNEAYAGTKCNIAIETVVSSNVLEELGQDACYNSFKKELPIDVLGAPEVVVSGGNLSWQNIEHVATYKIYVDDVIKAETQNNSFNLMMLENFNTLITATKEHEIKVVPVLEQNVLNVAQSTKNNVTKVKRLQVGNVVCDGYDIKWQESENASVYHINLYEDSELILSASTETPYFSMKNHNAGNYTINVQAIAGENEFGSVNYISSETIDKDFAKFDIVNANILNYTLNLENLGEDDCLIEFNISAGNNYSSTYSENALSLADYEFDAGEHAIKIKRLGNTSVIDSNETVVKFVQLEKIEDAVIVDGKFTVERSTINSNAVITLKTSGTSLTSDLIFEGNEYLYNTTNSENADYLVAGTYLTEVYVYGDGSATFSYRESGNVVATTSANLEVLSAPNCVLNDTAVEIVSFNEINNASAYDVYIVNGEEKVAFKNVDINEFDFELNNGSVTYVVQAMGDGNQVLNSCYSQPITISRLVTPTLKFNSATNIISLIDVNTVANVSGYVFTHNGVEVSYDFVSAFAFEMENEFTIYAIAKAGSNGNYYLNSAVDTYNFNKISNLSTIELDENNNLVIVPTEHNEEYSLEVVFNFDSSNKTFVTSNGKLTDGSIELDYTYTDGKYIVDLIDDQYNAIIDETVNTFNVKVKFVKESTGDDTIVNSDYTEEETLTLNKISSVTMITINEENELVITPENHVQEYQLRLIINDGTEKLFKSNNGKLVCESIQLPYVYESGSYYITLLNDDYTTIISNLNSSFTAKVKYSYNDEGFDTDLDSVYSDAKTISVQPISAITRDGQKIRITNVKETYTHINYNILVNNYPISLDDTAVSSEGFVTFDVEYIYNHVDADEYIQEVNIIEVLVKNIDTTNETPVLSTKSGKLLIQKTDLVQVQSYKYNNNEDSKNNNSAVVWFETYETTYTKQYIVEFYNAGNKIHTLIFVDADAQNGKITFNMDSIEELSSISGLIDVVVYVQTEGSYSSAEGVVNVFNSNKANKELNKIDVVSSVNVSNSTISFNAVSNAVGYEIWEITGTGKKKFNSNLITSTSYEISNITGEKQFVVKAISITDGCTNSSDSEVVKVNKVQTPVVTVVDGKFNVKLSSALVGLLTNSNISIIPEITNGLGEVISFDIGDLDGEELKLEIKLFTPILVAEPYLFLSYNTASLMAEKLSFKLKIEQTSAVDGVYYLNSDQADVDCHGLFEPSALKKTTDENNTVEMLSWVASDKNVLNGSALTVGYVLKIEYTKDETTNVYYTSDSKLKYYDKTKGTYVSYSKFITGTSAVFPAGYDSNNDGELDIVFEAGTYKVSVQAVPQSSISGYNLCSSKYSTSCEFEIMATSQLTTEEGKIVWTEQAKANHYVVSIYEQGETTPVLIDKTFVPEYDFSNVAFKNSTGVYSVVVKSISTSDDALNSAESKPYYVYRLPQASAVSVDDGHLILTATKFFSKAKIELIDTVNGTTYELPLLQNDEEAAKNLIALGIGKWDEFTDEALINATQNYAVSVDNEVLKILDGRDYKINVTLLGNTNSNLGMITSSTSVSLSNMVATKLKPNAIEVNLGVIQFKPDVNYATISADGVYNSLISLNYEFNNSISSAFWNKTTVYKLVVTTSEGVHNVYAVDYYSLLTAINNDEIDTSEYQLLNDSYGMYAWVKYPYIDGEETKTLYFNVFKENKINLRDYDELIHYSVEETMENGVNMFACATTSSHIALVGTIDIDVYMLGGDSYIQGDNVIAHLSAQSNDLNEFERYGKNELTSFEGMVQFNNLIPLIDGVAIDNPVYKIVLTQLNSEESTTYYIYHTTLEDARTVAMRHDLENYNNAVFLQIGNEEETVYELENTIIFDLTKFVEPGTYKASIRTLAGMGKEGVEVDDYYINAKVPGVEYTFFKLADTEFELNGGVLEFNQSYILQDGTKICSETYEVTIYDATNNLTYVYDIDRTSDGVTINDATKMVKYVLPSQITVGEQVVAINGGIPYQIKIRAKSADAYTLNGTYKIDGEEDYYLSFEKSLGISELPGEGLRIEDGILKWKVLDPENHTYTVIKVSFLDENSQIKNLFIKVSDLNKVEVDGEYQYHFYTFTDELYQLESTGSVYIQDKLLYNIGDGTKEERIINYEIIAYTVGTVTETKNVLDSNYSTKIETNRLSKVQDATIKTQDGILTWLAVDGAKSYNVTLIGETEYSFNAEESMLDLSNEELPVGRYSVKIRAIGDDAITSMMSNIADGFTMLDIVDVSSVRIDNSDVVWDEVYNAQGYKITFDYTSLSGETKTITEIIETARYTAPTDIQGKFTISIAATGVGEGKVFNGKVVTFTSSNDAPMQVSKVEFDAEKSRIVIEVKTSDFLTGDSLLIVYNLAEYISNIHTANTKLESETITYLQAGKYSKIDDETYHYYYPLSIIGKYSNISVQVVRPGTVSSNSVQIADIDFKLFSYGAGTAVNPYRIADAQHLLNIKYFNSAHFELSSSINMSEVNYAERLNKFKAVVSEEFSGVLNGNNYSIFGFNKNTEEKTDTIALTGTQSFAMFKILNNAIIKNLTFGEENYQLILSNTFANNVANMINLSLITTGANNSIIENVNVINFKIEILADANNTKTEQLTEKVYISALVNSMTNGRISNSKVNFSANVGIKVTNDVYLGALVSSATSTNIENNTITFSPVVSTDSSISYLGGVVAYYVGNTSRTTGIKNTYATMNFTSIKAIYVGGLAGFARYINIEGCETSGTYTNRNINYDTYMGGLVGYAQSSLFTNSGSRVQFVIAVSNSTNKYFGVVAGMLTIINNVSSEVKDCYMYNYDYLEKTNVTTASITMGIYTHKDSAVVITNCYKKEQ